MATPDGSTDPMPGGWQTEVRRVGDTVRRSSSPWSRSVIDFLSHLDRVAFRGAPRPVGDGFDEEDNEILTFVEGESPHPNPWREDALAELGALLAELHRAARSYDPPTDAVWNDWYGRSLGTPSRGFGHGDLGPWNIIAQAGSPVGFIDWDTAGPLDPTWELAQVAWLNVQLHDDDVAEVVGLGDAATRAAQLRILLDGYGLPHSDRAGFVDKMVAVAVHDAAGDARRYEVRHDTTTGVGPDGYPFAWGLAWRARSASWMLRHRRLLEAALDQ